MLQQVLPVKDRTFIATLNEVINHLEEGMAAEKLTCTTQIIEASCPLCSQMHTYEVVVEMSAAAKGKTSVPTVTQEVLVPCFQQNCYLKLSLSLPPGCCVSIEGIEMEKSFECIG